MINVVPVSMKQETSEQTYFSLDYLKYYKTAQHTSLDTINTLSWSSTTKIIFVIILFWIKLYIHRASISTCANANMLACYMLSYTLV